MSSRQETIYTCDLCGADDVDIRRIHHNGAELHVAKVIVNHIPELNIPDDEYAEFCFRCHDYISKAIENRKGVNVKSYEDGVEVSCYD